MIYHPIPESHSPRNRFVPGQRFKLQGSRFVVFAVGALLLSLGFPVVASIPAPEKLLPDDTLILMTAPDFAKLRESYAKMPQRLFWDDPAMKGFTDKFVAKWNEEFVEPLERELDIKCADYFSLLQGQLTFALTQNGWQGQEDQPPGLLFLLDARDKSDQLKKNLADLRKKWIDRGKVLRTEKIRDVEFTVMPVSSNDVPKTMRRFFPPSQPVQELGDENKPQKPAPKNELVIGQMDSLLILGNSTKAVEKVVIRLGGGSLPALADSAAYQATHQALFRDAPLYGWINTKALFDAWLRKTEQKENPEAPNPFDPNFDKILPAIGLTGLKTLSASFRDTPEGGLLQVFLNVPESSRQGLFKILAGEAKEWTPPPFVPADAIKFQRWRLDGQKAWATLEKILSDISPQAIGTLNFLLDSANTYAKDKDPGFDIRKNLLGNLGDDVISYEKAPRGTSSADLRSPPSLFLLGSPRAEELAAALKSILVFLSQQAGSAPEQREFLGRKIYSVALRGISLPGAKPTGARTLHYSASNGYLALSTDVSMLEEYLRSSDTQAKALRETSGLTDAAQKVTGPGTSLFGYVNQAETMRILFDLAKKDPGSVTNSVSGAGSSLVPGGLGLPNAAPLISDWMDFSLLPAFDKVAKYFSFTVYGGSTTVEGLTFKWFAPVPSGLRH